MPSTITAATANARALLDEWDHNNFDGSSPIGELARARYAVVIEREEDSWVRAANGAADLAAIERACYFATEGYDEWIEGVYSIETGESVEWNAVWTVRVAIGDEEVTS